MKLHAVIYLLLAPALSAGTEYPPMLSSRDILLGASAGRVAAAPSYDKVPIRPGNERVVQISPARTEQSVRAQIAQQTPRLVSAVPAGQLNFTWRPAITTWSNLLFRRPAPQTLAPMGGVIAPNRFTVTWQPLAPMGDVIVPDRGAFAWKTLAPMGGVIVPGNGSFAWKTLAPMGGVIVPDLLAVDQAFVWKPLAPMGDVIVPDYFTIGLEFDWATPHGPWMNRLLGEIDAAKAAGDIKTYRALTARYAAWAEKYLRHDAPPDLDGLR